MLKSLKSRIIAPMVGILAVVIIVIVVYVSVAVEDLGDALARERMDGAASAAESKLSNFEDKTRIIALSTANDFTLISNLLNWNANINRAQSRQNLIDYLRIIARQMGVDSFVIRDFEGRIVLRLHDLAAYNDIDGSAAGLAALRGETTTSYSSTPTMPMGLNSTTPIIHEGEIIGTMTPLFFLYTDEFLKDFAQAFRAEVTIFSGYTRVATTLVNQAGQRVVGTDLDNRQIIDAVLGQGQSITLTTTIFGEQYYSHYFPIFGLAGNAVGMIFIGFSTQSTAAAIFSLQLILIIIGVAALAAGILFALFVARRITRPLVVSSGLLREISRALDSAVNIVNDSATSIAESSNEQAASVEETSATLNETSSMIASNAENTRVAAQLAVSSVEITNNTGMMMGRMMETMNELKESSKAIGKIVKTIDDIAFQTNLLAINATVEAARAGGDAGRSFGVVAEEVRSLAQKSAQSASDTTEIIERDIQLTASVSKEAESVMELAKKSVSEMTNLSKLIAEVNAAGEEQASGVGQINTAMSQIEKSTQANAATSQESAASAAMLKELVADLEKVYNDVNAVVHGSGG